MCQHKTIVPNHNGCDYGRREVSNITIDQVLILHVTTKKFGGFYLLLLLLFAPTKGVCF